MTVSGSCNLQRMMRALPTLDSLARCRLPTSSIRSTAERRYVTDAYTTGDQPVASPHNNVTRRLEGPSSLGVRPPGTPTIHATASPGARSVLERTFTSIHPYTFPPPRPLGRIRVGGGSVSGVVVHTEYSSEGTPSTSRCTLSTMPRAH